MSKEALKQSLITEAAIQSKDHPSKDARTFAKSVHEYLMAEQPAQQEPVAWVCEGSSSDEKHAIDYWPGDIEDIPIGTKLYTSPPAQRTWVGLTDEEITDIWAEASPYYHEDDFARAIEAKLKEKNT